MEYNHLGYHLIVAPTATECTVLLLMFLQLFPQLQTVMVEPLKTARDHWEKLKEQDDEIRRKQQA